MTTFARNFTRVVLAVLMLASPLAAGAQNGDASSFTWLAASSSEPTIAATWGRLTMKNGVLMFRSSDAEWEVAVNEIKRAAVSPSSDHLIVIELADGSVRYVAIIGTSMLVESPRKTLDAIHRAMRGAVSRRY